METQETTLAGKIAAASLDVGGKLNPDKRNQEQRYDYISADKILAVCGQALAAQGVAVFPEITGVVADTVNYTKTYQGRVEEKSRIDARVQFSMKVTDGRETCDLMWIGFGTDYATPDKAVYKAITSGHKYFMVKLLNVGAGNEDSEHDEQDQPTTQQLQQAQPQPQRKPTVSTGNEDIRDDPPGFKIWADWSRPEHAIKWAMTQGVFGHQKHAQNAYDKVKAERKPETASDMWQFWYNDVQRRIAEKQEYIIKDAFDDELLFGEEDQDRLYQLRNPTITQH